jgi:hypothetical protein
MFFILDLPLPFIPRTYQIHSRVLPQLYHTYTLLEHQFQTWITRNEAQPIRDYKPSYARPKRPTQPISPTRHKLDPNERKSASADPRRTPGTNIANSGNVPDYFSTRRPRQAPTRHAAEKRPLLLRTHENAAGGDGEG